MIDPVAMVGQFVLASGEIDMESMRQHILDTMSRNLAWTEYLLHNPLHQEHWKNLKDYVITHTELADHTQKIRAIREIDTLPDTIEGWIHENLDTAERLEFSIRSKALELSTGDEMFDYFTAIRIRHDQLLAANEIFSQGVTHLSHIVEIADAQMILETDEWLFFERRTLDEQIFGLSRDLYAIREQKDSIEAH